MKFNSFTIQNNNKYIKYRSFLIQAYEYLPLGREGDLQLEN